MIRRLVDYRDLVGETKIHEIYRKASEITANHILHINSTYYGGGVAEILRSMVPLLNRMGLDVGWRALVGSPDFFRVTKKFHNALQGEEINLTDWKKKIYEETNRMFCTITHIHHDLVVVHDPQPLPIINFCRKTQPWIWRCHIDLSTPNQELWRYLRSFGLPFDLAVYQMEEYAWRETECRTMLPSIDPLSVKNREIPKGTEEKYIKGIGIDPERPLISQVSRFDRWKDPIGVLKVFDRVREEMDCQLVLAGSMATDDPESQEIYERVIMRAKDMDDVRVILDAHDILVNSIQRASDVVLQKSLREGFGLTASEALWKRTPVVASDVGGLSKQVIREETGYLVDPRDYEEAAEKVMNLIEDQALNEEMGRKGKEHVRENFFITRHIEDWIDIWREILE